MITKAKISILFRVALLLVCMALFADMGFAQEGGDAPAPGSGGESMTALDFIRYGGLIGGVLIAASVAGLGMSIERAIGLKRDNIVPPHVLDQLEGLFEEEEFEEAMTVCESQPCFLTNVIAAGLPKIGTSWENISDSMREVGDFEATKLQQSISYINLIVNTAPMIGLFGTVTGMIGAFQVIASATTAPSPKELAGGIQQALVTTCMGLAVSIPFAFVYFYFRNKVQRQILEVAAISDELMDRFKE